MTSMASNRQKKLLKFFGIPFGANISLGAAGWEIAAILANENNRELWRRYVYFTKDLDATSDELMPYKIDELLQLKIPEDWSIQDFRADIAEQIFREQTPFDSPQPDVVFKGNLFVFTGKFDFGERTLCQKAVIKKGGIAPNSKSVNQDVDYLVIGTQGNPNWKRGAYGTKIEAAILARRDYGTPSIISENHWKSFLLK